MVCECGAYPHAVHTYTWETNVLDCLLAQSESFYICQIIHHQTWSRGSAQWLKWVKMRQSRRASGYHLLGPHMAPHGGLFLASQPWYNTRNWTWRARSRSDSKVGFFFFSFSLQYQEPWFWGQSDRRPDGPLRPAWRTRHYVHHPQGNAHAAHAALSASVSKLLGHSGISPPAGLLLPDPAWEGYLRRDCC